MFKAIPAGYEKVARRILIWVALSRDDVSSEMLAEAAVIDPDERDPFDTSMRLPRLKDVSGLFRLLPGLFTTFKSGNSKLGIRFTHFSVQEFLFSTEISQLETVSQYRIDKHLGNILIADSCLCYHFHASQVENVIIKTYDNLFPLWRYAAIYWMDHMEAVPQRLWTATLKTRAMSLLQPRTDALRRMAQIDRLKYSNIEETILDDKCSWDNYSTFTAPPPYYIAQYGCFQILSWYAESIGLDEFHDQINTASEEILHRALQVAAFERRKEVVSFLLDRGAEVNAQGGRYGNALQAAAIVRQQTEIVALLLDRGAEVNAQGGQYGNALQAAASSWPAETVLLLLDRGADVNAQGGLFGNALQAAARGGETETVALLLDRGAEVNAQGGRFGCALQAAASKRRSDAVDLLLDRGADVNVQGGRYGNALEAAACRGGRQIVTLLLDQVQRSTLKVDNTAMLYKRLLLV
jgi:ankyrin repeat protein